MYPDRDTIDHFHYDVTRAKVSGSCSKDRAQYRAIAGKVSKNQQKCHVDQGKLPGVSQGYVLDCYTNSKKFSLEFLSFFR